MAPTRTISRPLISTSFSPSKKQTENLLKLLLLRRRQGHKRFLSSSQIVLCLYNDIRATPFVPRPPIVVCLSSKSICQGVKAMLLICAQSLGWLLGGEVGMKLGRRTALESLIEQGRFWSPMTVDCVLNCGVKYAIKDRAEMGLGNCSNCVSNEKALLQRGNLGKFWHQTDFT